MINFSLTEEQELIKNSAKRFATEFLLPGVIDRDENGIKLRQSEIHRIFQPQIRINHDEDSEIIDFDFNSFSKDLRSLIKISAESFN